jgi:hypothetical protein
MIGGTHRHAHTQATSLKHATDPPILALLCSMLTHLPRVPSRQAFATQDILFESQGFILYIMGTVGLPFIVKIVAKTALRIYASWRFDQVIAATFHALASPRLAIGMHYMARVIIAAKMARDERSQMCAQPQILPLLPGPLVSSRPLPHEKHVVGLKPLPARKRG